MNLAEKFKPIVTSYNGEPYLYEEDALTGKHGAMGLLNLFELNDEEVLYLGQVEFQSKDEYEQAIHSMYNDEIIKELYEQICEVVDVTSMITSTFQDIKSEV